MKQMPSSLIINYKLIIDTSEITFVVKSSKYENARKFYKLLVNRPDKGNSLRVPTLFFYNIFFLFLPNSLC